MQTGIVVWVLATLLAPRAWPQTVGPAGQQVWPLRPSLADADPANFPAKPSPPATAAPPSAIALTIRRRVEEVRLSFTVSDKHERPVAGLEPGDVKVLYDGRAIESFTSFSRTFDPPLRLGLLVDYSESMKKGFAEGQRVTLEFLQRLVRPAVDKVFVMGFAAQAETSRPFSTPLPLRLAASHFHAGGETALYDALVLACDHPLMEQLEAPAVRRAIILLSDGEDNYSRHNLEDVLEMAQRAEIPVYSISVHSPRLELVGDRVLRRLAGATGGRAFFLAHSTDVPRALAAVENELRAGYVLSFRPLAPTHGYHQIKVLTASRYRVRARAGYYAEPQP